MSVQRIASRLSVYRRNFEPFASDCLVIYPKSGEPTTLNIARRPAQQLYHHALLEQLERQQFARLILFKNRQQGTSTYTQGIVFWRCALNHGTNGLVVAHDKETAEKLFFMGQTFYQHMPADIRPMVRHSTKSELRFENPDSEDRLIHPGLGGGIVVATARNIHSGAGRTLQVVQLCLSPETMVWTPDNLVKISTLVSGDRILTGTGEVARVMTVTTQPSDTRPWVKLETWGSPHDPLICTADHPILTTTGWKPAGEIQRNERVLMPIQKPKGTITQIPLNRYYEPRYSALKNRRYDRWQCGETSFPLTHESGWFLGLFLAEGYVTKTGKVTLCLGGNEQHLADRAVKFAEKYAQSVGVRFRSATRLQVDFYGTGFSDFLSDICYASPTHRAHTKCLPSWTYEGSEDFLRGMVYGYFQGDGHTGRRGVMASTVSSHLAAGMRDLLMTLGYGWPSLRFASAGRRYGRNCSDSWTLYVTGESGRQFSQDCFGRSWNPSTCPRERSKWQYHYPEYLSLRVRSVTTHPAQPYMTNVEVDHPHHSFRCVQSVVKNSEAARYENAEELQTAIFDAVPLGYQSIIIIESTAAFNAAGSTWFQELCEDAQKPGSDTPWRFCFAGWNYDPECWVALLPGEVIEPTGAERLLDQQFEDWRASVKQWCPYPGLRPEQLKWRRLKMAEYRGNEDLFKLSFPLTPEEAWYMPGAPLVTSEMLRHHRETCRPPIVRAEVRPVSDGSNPVVMSLDGPLSLWEWPIAGEQYDIGVDVAEGKGGDYSVAVVFRRSTKTQVATYRSNTIEPGTEFVGVLQALGLFYNTAQIAVETKGPGLYTNGELGKVYSNLHIWRHRDAIGKRQLTTRTGWDTTPTSKEYLVGQAMDYLSTARVTIRDLELWDELSRYRCFGNRGYGAAKGHDDIVMAFMIGLVASCDETTPGMETIQAVVEPQETRDPATYDRSWDTVLVRAETRARGRESFLPYFDETWEPKRGEVW